MSKVMFVTVGTSLFHSASWEPDKAVLLAVKGYEKWTASDDVLKKPEERKQHPEGRSIQKHLEGELKTINASTWAQRLPSDLTGGNPDRNTFMRYSAELATILKLFAAEGETDQSLADFLRSYDHIYLPCDSSGKGTANLAHVAAHHLAAYLNRLAGKDGLAQVLSVYGLSSTQRDVLLGETAGLGRLAKLIEDEKAEQQDFVISGGYKLYGMYLFALLNTTVRAARFHYIHEDGDRLLTISRPSSDIEDEDWLFEMQ